MIASFALKNASVSVAHRMHRCVLVPKRNRYKKKWAVNLPSKTPCELALEHFDAFYKPLFGKQWPSIRIALLSQSKYAAIINNAADPDVSFQLLTELGARDLVRDTANLVNRAKLKEDAFPKLQTTGSEQNVEKSSLEVEDPDSQSKRNSFEGDHAEHADSSFTTSHQSEGYGIDDAQVNFRPFRQTCEVGDSRGTEAMDNVLTPDALHNSTDLQHFMPTEQVFSEKEELRQAEHVQSTFQERPISVTVLPGQHPVLPPVLKVMAFPPGNVSDFPAPKVDAANILNYYLLDAASILPVIALDLRPDDEVLDLCSAPGGKTLTMLQVILSQGGHITSNDYSQSRIRRLRTVLTSYLPRSLQSDFVTVTERLGQSYRDPVYSKVLVDVPCNSDRHVLLEEDNNLFKPGRIKDRLHMTTLQKDLLLAGIRSCKPGGSVVYSTCTLAAVQNDGVVQAAVEELWETSDIDVAVEDLSQLKTAFSHVFRFHPSTRLGQLVLPSLTSNFGPMYICKLKRLQ